ncbi:hypothetical protein [Pyramidobacter porci]|uniref:hypothetical protein n=1 Tax=Pyramidobacter porci TaxID=2605789 RepID=UPI002A766BF4|nr:hypothetical protein [Pyramidobacter porci]
MSFRAGRKKSFRAAAFVRGATFTPSGDVFSRRRAYDSGKNVDQAVFFPRAFFIFQKRESLENRQKPRA